MNKLKPMRFAHTGVTQFAPENTWEAYEKAIEMGFEGIELDVQLTMDNKVVCNHDETLFRPTSGADNRRLDSLTLEEIKSVPIPFNNRLLPRNPPVPWTEKAGGTATINPEGSEDERTTHLIGFEDFDRKITELKADITVEIEVKRTGIVEPLDKILKNSENASKYILFSGEKEVNEEIQGYYRTHEKPLGLRFGANIRFLTDENMKLIEKWDLYEVGLNNEAFTKKDVDFLMEKGIRVFSNLGDYEFWWQKISEYGVEGFKTNYPQAYTEFINKNK